MAGALLWLGPCGGCGRTTAFDPEDGPSVLIDPTTGLPPDIGGTDPAEARREPLCEHCIAAIRFRLASQGKADPWPRWRGLDTGKLQPEFFHR